MQTLPFLCARPPLVSPANARIRERGQKDA